MNRSTGRNSKLPPRTQPKPWAGHERSLIIAGALLLAVMIWALWPSPFGRVASLNSKNSGIIAFGDSLTAGYGAAPGEDYPSELSRRVKLPITNRGVNGDTTESALLRLERDVLTARPRLVLVGLGGNDFLRGVPPSTTEANLREIIRKIHAEDSMVMLLGFSFPSMSANYARMYERIARDERCLLVPDVLDGILSKPELKSDEIHPNGKGYRLMAERLEGPTLKLVRKADKAR